MPFFPVFSSTQFIRRSSLRSCIGALFACVSICLPLAAEERPNVLLIMADDLGFADVGSYGGEIETPNIDRLASGGVRFSQFRVSPMCSTTRVALMAGMSYAAAGSGSYEGTLPLPSFLQNAGYRTMMTGKWHAGNVTPRLSKVFNRFFGFIGGMSDCFVGGSDWFEGQKPFKDFAPGFDATTAFTDRSIDYMEEALEDEEPFFMFVSYNAPHHPLQAQKETVDKYRGRYMEGYSAIREKRYARQLEMGLIDPDWEPAAHGVEVRRWEELPEHRKVVEDARMSAYAAMVDEMDQGIGRLIDFLEAAGELENTIIMFMSDNGGDYNNGSIKLDAAQIPWKAHHNPTSSNGWAWVKNAPFNYYKHACHEGALAVPFIVHWPKGLNDRAGTINRSSTSVTDIYPTLLELAGLSYPPRNSNLKPLTGKSFVASLKDGEVFDAPSRFLWFNQSRAWIEDDMKAVSLYGGPWQLYDLTEDRTEQYNLANSQRRLTKQLAKKWQDYAQSIKMHPALRQPVEKAQRGWGWHRLKMFSPQLVSTFPENSKLTDPGSTRLEMKFSAPVDLSGINGKSIRLYKVSDELNPVWEMDPDESHPNQGQRKLCFKNLPALEPDTQYYVWIDAGAFKVGGKRVGVINDGAYWWRFRTESK
ncbi:MAG: sulfatase-like hydrolase/transferase [Lentimonas sp.]